MRTSGEAEPLAAFEALSWLCANHPDRTLKERAYAFSVALEWKDNDSGMLDTVTLQSWQESGRTTDVDQAADLFVVAIEDLLIKQTMGALRSGTLRGLGALGLGKHGREHKVARLLEAAKSPGDQPPALLCYLDYRRCLESEQARWSCATGLAISIRRALAA